MAASSLKYHVSDYFKGVIQDFTLLYILKKPDDLSAFGVEYFQKLKGERVKPKFEREVEEDYIPPATLAKRRATVCDEAYDPHQDDDVDYLNERVVHAKPLEEVNFLRDQLQRNLLFRQLDDKQLTELIDAFFERKVEENEKVIQQGDDGDFFYMVGSGTFYVYKKENEEEEPKLVGKHQPGDTFGEIALMYNIPRTASVVARSDGMLWVLKRNIFKRIVVRNAYVKSQQIEDIIHSVPLFSVLNREEQLNVYDALKVSHFSNFDYIVHQGDVANGMFFILSGSVEISMVTPAGDVVKLAVLFKGDYFGELALLTHQKRAASAAALGPVTVGFLDVEAFERLLGPCLELMKRNMSIYEHELERVNKNVTDSIFRPLL